MQEHVPEMSLRPQSALEPGLGVWLQLLDSWSIEGQRQVSAVQPLAANTTSCPGLQSTAQKTCHLIDRTSEYDNDT